jgi:hypothetical protein
MKVLWLLIGIMLSQFWVTAADARTTVWHWVSRDNSLCYTNDDKMIPKMYADRVVEITLDGLDSYEKYTPVQGKTEINAE